MSVGSPKNRPERLAYLLASCKSEKRVQKKLFEDLVICSQHVAESLPLLDSVHSIITILWSLNCNPSTINFNHTPHTKLSKQCVELAKEVKSRGISTIH